MELSFLKEGYLIRSLTFSNNILTTKLNCVVRQRSYICIKIYLIAVAVLLPQLSSLVVYSYLDSEKVAFQISFLET